MSVDGTKQTRDAAVKTEHILRASRRGALKGARAFFCRQPRYPVKGEASEACDATSRKPVDGPDHEGCLAEA